MERELHEKCAVVGAADASGDLNRAAILTHMGLFALQHRGTESSGIVSSTNGDNLIKHRGAGLVKDVFSIEDIKGLEGDISIGHNRYATNGDKYDPNSMQPFWYLSMGLAFAHNGNLPDTSDLESHLRTRYVRTGAMNDSRMMGSLICENLRKSGDIIDATQKSTEHFVGAYSCVTSFDGTLVGFRDPYGIRPLSIGTLDDAYVIASESCALDTMGAEFLRDIEPGEIVATDGKELISHRFAEANLKLDMFEPVYFARPDSIINGMSVDQVRRNFGSLLADEFPPNADLQEDVLVVPVPSTSIPAAEAYAEKLGLNLRHAIVKSSYVGRTFIEGEQEQRVAQLRLKHNMMPHLVRGKDVILIDDSIVRLNTIPALVARARELGARSVSVLIASPPVRFPDFYGIDTPMQDQLAAAVMTCNEMEKEIECNRLGFLTVSQTVQATGIPAGNFNLSSFTGEYPIDIGDENRAKIKKPKSLEYAD
jgi:amidophosphoribosyltransferase